MGKNNTANYILYWRKKRGLTQQKLADISKTTQSTITRIETGNQEAKIGTMSRIADALNVTVDQLIVKE